MTALLRRRSSDEIRERLAQKFAAIAERVGAIRLSELDRAALTRKVRPADRPQFESADGWSRGLLRGHFFPSFDDLPATVTAVDRMDPRYREWARQLATRAAAGVFDLLGHRDVRWPTPIVWALEPQHAVTAPRAHWSRIDYLDPRVAGDHKLVWELNRLQWLIPVAQLARLTGDPRWSQQCIDTLDQWMTANPPGIGVNWASSLEVSYRAIAWLWVLRYLEHDLPEAFAARIAGFLWHAGRHIERYLSTYFSPNTHLTGEALGLLYIGTQLGQFECARRWRDCGWNILCEQVTTHIRPDGTYFEQATWYHRYTVDIYLHAVILAERNGLAVPGVLRDRLELAVRHLMALTRPDGSMPLMGDDDGGKLVQLDDRTPHFTQTALAQGAVLFGRSDLASSAGSGKGPGSELAWLLGSEGASTYERLRDAAPPPGERSIGFGSGGLFVLRDGWGPTASVAVVDCGPHGVMNCGHAHADVLSFDLTVRGHAVLVDPGTASYVLPDLRDGFRSSAAHNTVTLDGRSSSVVAGPFRWQSVAQATVEGWVTSPAADFFQGSHDGYARLSSPATHRRSILHVRGEYWLVVDEIVSGGDHQCVSVFQGGVGCDIKDLGSGMFRYCRDKTEVLSLQVVAGGDSAISRRQVSDAYGVTASAAAVVVSARTHGPARMVTLMSLPTEELGASLVDSAGDHLALEIRGRLGADLVRLGPGGPWSLGDVSGDVRCAWVRRGADQLVTASLGCGGTRLSASGRPLGVLPLMSGEVRG